MIYHLYAMVLAYLIDWLIGDPEKWPHPVKGFGKLIAVLDQRLNHGKRRKTKGMLLLFVLVGTAFVTGFVLITLGYMFHPIAGVVVEGILIATTIAQNNLAKAVLRVYQPLQNHELENARLQLSYIVGRDTENLAEPEIVRGAVETVAENTSDGITAPLFWSLIGGAPLALVYRAVNTCDSMVGYRNETYREFGWASAKLDDVLNWVPARLTAFVMLVVQKPYKTSRSKAWHMLLRDARKHNSPNAGWVEAAVAALLGVQLGGTNTYQGEVSNSPVLGEARTSLMAIHIRDVITIMQRSVFLFFICLLIGGVLVELAITRI